MSYLVLARKWRPKGFDDLIGQEPITRILKNAILQNKIAHAYIFSGPRGVGKTSTARILAKALNCKEGPTPLPCGTCELCTAVAGGSSVDVIEIDGASNNSVDDIRDLREKVKYAPSAGKYKIYIIDETHMLSISAFNALLKTLEEPPSHVIFVLATTAIKKVPATILSRCQHMPFRKISGNEIKARLKEISDAEDITISPAALGLVARAADGSMRDSLTILDQLSSFSTAITEEEVKSLLGIADIGMLMKLSAAILTGNRVDILDTVNLLSERGTDIRTFTKELAQFFRDLLVASVMREPGDVLDLNEEELAAVRGIVSVSSESQLTLMLSDLMKAEAEVRNSSSPRLALEMALIRASYLSSVKPIEKIIESLDRYGKHAPDDSGEKTGVQKRRDEKPLKTPPADKKDRPEQHVDTFAGKPAPRSSNVQPVVGDVVEDVAGNEKKNTGIGIVSSWEKTLEKIDAPLASKLSKAAYEFSGEEFVITLNGGHSVFEDAIKKNLRSIEKIMSEESGSKIRIRLATGPQKSPRKNDLKEKIINEPVIKEALELFEGRIVNVTPAENSSVTENGGENV